MAEHDEQAESVKDVTIREGIYKGQQRHYEPVICMFNAQGKHQPGWLANQPDILADDWQVVPHVE